jgi:hypothetical protein
MEHFKNETQINSVEFAKIIENSLNPPYLKGIIFVVCNDVRKLLETALEVTKIRKRYEVYFQRHPWFVSDFQGIFKQADWKQVFDDYCNFYDKHGYIAINQSNKQLYNYSKNAKDCSSIDYPKNIKMILIIESFNFWDLKSQSVMSKIPEENENIIVIGQIRSDFEFASNHVDPETKNNRTTFSLI